MDEERMKLLHNEFERDIGFAAAPQLGRYVRNSMKKIFIVIMFLISVQVISVEAAPLVIQCSGEKPYGNQIIHVQIDIALPQEKNKFIWVVGKDLVDPHPTDSTPVGVGSIEITEKLGNAKESHRHDFVVTRLPDARNSLIGFYLINSYVNSIRAELWEKKKTFIYFDTYNNEVLQGECH